MTWAARCVASALAVSLLLACPHGAAEPPPSSSEAMGPEILHMPELESRAARGILRPVPVSLELPPDLSLRARRVLLHYRLWGDPDWTSVELQHKGSRYDGVIPCLEISTVTGDLRYHVRVHDAEGRVIATGASPAKPYRVAIKHDTTLSQQGRRVAKCSDPADCPRGLPGCPSEEVVRVACQTDRDCTGGMTCGWSGYCEQVYRRKNWVLLSVEQDFGAMQASGACSIYAQENEGYACIRADGEQYAGAPVLTNEPLAVGRGPTRILLGYERLVFLDTSLGVRVGWAVSGEGPTPSGGTPFMPLSISVRATHWFGDDLFTRSGLRPFAFVTGGYAMFDIESTIRVREDPTGFSGQGGNDLEQTLSLWKRAGDPFIGIGAGLAFGLTAGTAAFVEIGALDAFPFDAVIVAPSAGVMLGF